MDEKKNSGQETLAQKVDRRNGERPVTAHEKAQYEVFANGDISKERIGEMIDNDLKAIMSFAHGMLHDKELRVAVVDIYYKRYKALHDNNKANASVPDKS